MRKFLACLAALCMGNAAFAAGETLSGYAVVTGPKTVFFHMTLSFNAATHDSGPLAFFQLNGSQFPSGSSENQAVTVNNTTLYYGVATISDSVYEQLGYGGMLSCVAHATVKNKTTQEVSGVASEAAEVELTDAGQYDRVNNGRVWNFTPHMVNFASGKVVVTCGYDTDYEIEFVELYVRYDGGAWQATGEAVGIFGTRTMFGSVTPGTVVDYYWKYKCWVNGISRTYTTEVCTITVY